MLGFGVVVVVDFDHVWMFRVERCYLVEVVLVYVDELVVVDDVGVEGVQHRLGRVLGVRFCHHDGVAAQQLLVLVVHVAVADAVERAVRAGQSVDDLQVAGELPGACVREVD